MCEQYVRGVVVGVDPKSIFAEHGGQLRMTEALALGISRYQLYKMRDASIVKQVTRGVYRLSSLSELSYPDLATVCLRYPNAVICLVSALSFHGLTTQIPHSVNIAVSRGTRLPRLQYPPISVHNFSGRSFSEGIDVHVIDGAKIRIYCKEKTLADCVKFRNKIGTDIIMESLKMYRKCSDFNVDTLMQYAGICRASRVIEPYLEALL